MLMTILLVDDEILICNWISVMISSLGRSDVSTVSMSNAEDALIYCQTHSVDLVLTDITMPQKSGLDLIEELSRTHPEIKTAVLSAYDDYKYIRETFKLGALDYILKSEIKPEDIISLLNKLQLFSGLTSDGSQYNSIVESHAALLQKQFKSLLTETISQASFLQYTALTPFIYDTGICLFHLNKGIRSDAEALSLLDILSRTIQGESLVGNSFMAEKDCFVCLFNVPTAIPEYQQNLMNKLMLLGQRNINEYSSFSVADCVFASTPASIPIRETILKLIDTLNIRSYYHNNSVFNVVPLPEDNIKTLNTALINDLTVGKYTEALNCLQSFVDTAHVQLWDPKQLRTVIIYTVTVMYSFLDRLPTTKQYFGEYERIVKRISQAPSAEALSSVLCDFRANYIRSVDNNTRQITPTIQRVVDYINEYYMSRLTLENIAEHVFLNKTYLSQLFARQMNMSLGSYIEKVRIQRAKSLLATTSLSISQISEETGYSSQSYFTKVFKKATGVSPLKYRTLFSARSDISP